MNGPEHYKKAESVLADLQHLDPDEDDKGLILEALVYATLAVAAALIDSADDIHPTARLGWTEATS